MPHTPIRFVAAMLLAVASLSATAEIHRCKNEHGQTTLSDRPCGADNAAAADGRRSGAGVVADRIAAPQMVSARLRDGAGQYDFIPDRAAQPAARHQQGAK